MSAGPNMWILKTNDQNQKVGFLPLIHQHFSFVPVKRKAGRTSQLSLLNRDFTPFCWWHGFSFFWVEGHLLMPDKCDLNPWIWLCTSLAI